MHPSQRRQTTGLRFPVLDRPQAGQVIEAVKPILVLNIKADVGPAWNSSSHAPQFQFVWGDAWADAVTAIDAFPARTGHKLVNKSDKEAYQVLTSAIYELRMEIAERWIQRCREGLMEEAIKALRPNRRPPDGEEAD